MAGWGGGTGYGGSQIGDDRGGNEPYGGGSGGNGRNRRGRKKDRVTPTTNQIGESGTYLAQNLDHPGALGDRARAFHSGRAGEGGYAPPASQEYRDRVGKENTQALTAIGGVFASAVGGPLAALAYEGVNFLSNSRSKPSTSLSDTGSVAGTLIGGTARAAGLGGIFGFTADRVIDANKNKNELAQQRQETGGRVGNITTDVAFTNPSGGDSVQPTSVASNNATVNNVADRVNPTNTTSRSRRRRGGLFGIQPNRRY